MTLYHASRSQWNLIVNRHRRHGLRPMLSPFHRPVSLDLSRFRSLWNRARTHWVTRSMTPMVHRTTFHDAYQESHRTSIALLGTPPEPPPTSGIPVCMHRVSPRTGLACKKAQHCLNTLFSGRTGTGAPTRGPRKRRAPTSIVPSGASEETVGQVRKGVRAHATMASSALRVRQLRRSPGCGCLHRRSCLGAHAGQSWGWCPYFVSEAVFAMWAEWPSNRHQAPKTMYSRTSATTVKENTDFRTRHSSSKEGLYSNEKRTLPTHFSPIKATTTWPHHRKEFGSHLGTKERESKPARTNNTDLTWKIQGNL